MKIRIVFLILFVGACVYNHSQAQVTLTKEHNIAISHEDSVIVLEPWIVAETFRVRADTLILSEEEWSLNSAQGIWKWHAETDVRVAFDSLHFHYEIWPLNLPHTYFERELVAVDTVDEDKEPDGPVEITRRPLRRQELFADTELQRSGSLRRGIVVGSNQDFSMDSGLNFDLSGYVTEDIEVLASLTDRSTPIQPEGTTQMLREFDQVYIRLMHDIGMLQMGDVDMQLDQSNFAVIDRRLQGLDIQTDLDRLGTYQGSAAVARGRYHEMRFQGEDGVQGPYRLRGADNEEFIIVLAGSERVYLNGERMTRGEENDYVIDYGLGEITFTSNRIITDHSRIVVDFQYMRDDYTRTVVAAETEHDDLLNERISFGATIIRESDNVNLSTQLFLSETERDVLREAGDDPQKAVVSGVDSVGFRRDADFLLYSRVDTVFQDEQYEVFEHIAGDSSGVYRVQFSRVPDGEGDYQRVGRAANGILYEWAGPGMGNYMPERKISRPVEQNMIALRSRIKATSHIDVFGEWAGSYFDQNRLSAIDNENNQDMSFLAGVGLSPFNTRMGTVSFELRGRYEGENFAYFDRVREVEFDRRWNLPELDVSGEKRVEGTGGLELSEDTELNFSGGFIGRNQFEGNRGDFRLRSREEGLPGLDYFLERIESEDRNIDESGTWWRQRGRIDYDISLPLGSLHPEMEFEHEERRQKDRSSDSLLPTTFQFFEAGPGIYYQVTDEFRIGSSIRYREDKGVIDGSFLDESYGITQRYEMNYRRGSLFQTENTFGLRSRRFEEAFRIEQQRLDSRGVLVRSVTDYRPLDRFIETQVLYDANTERRPLLQETFIEVGPEMGQYVWIDLNDDGVRQVDEFFPEQSPNEGTFIKQLVPSDELFPVISLRARWRATVDPSRLIDPYDAQYSDWLDFLSGIRWHSIIDIREENRTEQLEDIYLLRLHKFRDDSLTINGRLYIEQDLELFRNNTRRELRITGDRMLSQSRQASGLEHRKMGNMQVRGGARLTRRYRLSAGAKIERSENNSEMFSSRNYDITGRKLRPKLDIRWGQSLQTGLEFSVIRRTDRLPENAAIVRGYTGTIDTRMIFGRRLQSTLRLEHRYFRLTGGPSSSLGEFELTDGAGLGRTWSWSLQTDYRISDFLRAGLQYDGRTLAGRDPIQTLRFTINAVF